MTALDLVADQQASYTALELRADHNNPALQEHDVLQRLTRAGFAPSLAAANSIWLQFEPMAGAPSKSYTYREMAAALVRVWMDSPGRRQYPRSEAKVHRLRSTDRARDPRGQTDLFDSSFLSSDSGGL